MAVLVPAWNQLPLEILEHIFKHVDDLQLLTAVAGTCLAWRDAVHVNHRSAIDFATLSDPYCVEDEHIYCVAALFGLTLTRLNLSGCGDLTSASFSCLQSQFPNLAQLVLNDLEILHLSQQHLAGLAGLKRLEMKKCRFGSMGGRGFAVLVGRTRQQCCSPITR